MSNKKVRQQFFFHSDSKRSLLSLQDYQNLVKEFHRLLQNATATHPLVLFLDSLDQLHSYNIIREMSWLPCKLPPHVKIVLSCLTGDRAFAALKVGHLIINITLIYII